MTDKDMCVVNTHTQTPEFMTENKPTKELGQRYKKQKKEEMKKNRLLSKQKKNRGEHGGVQTKMNVKKAIKKVIALGTGATMVGATLFGAMAYDLSSYPAPFVSNHEWDGLVVIGDTAKPIDTVSAANLVPSLQVAMIGGATATATVSATGDSVLLDAGDEIVIGESINQELDDGDLSILADGTFKENEGDNDNDVEYVQFLEIDTAAAGSLIAAYQANTEDDNNKAGMYIPVVDSDIVYTYTLNFKQAVEIDDGTVGDGAKTDMLATELNILGQSYTITNVELSAALVDKITMLTGSVEATQAEYSTQNYVVDGESYEVEVVVVTTDEAKFKINGQTSNALAVGEYDDVAGIQIGVKEILENEGTEAGGEDQVSFYLGSREIILENGDEVNVNGDDVYGSTVTITSTNAAPTTSMTEIAVEVAHDGDDVFLAAGDEWEDPVFDAISLNFAGLKEDSSVNVVDITTSSNSGKIEFENSVGDEIKLDLSKKNGANNAVLGDETTADGESFLDEDEALTTMASAAGTTDTSDHYFIVTTTDAGAKAHLFKIDKIVEDGTAGDDTVTVKDVTADVEEEVAIKIGQVDATDTTLFGSWNIAIETTAGPSLNFDESAGTSGFGLKTAATDAITAGSSIELNNGATMGIITGDDPTVFISEDGVRDYAAGDGISIQIVYTAADSELQVTQANVGVDGAAGLIADDDDASNYVDYTTWGAMLEWNDDNYDITVTSPQDQTEVLVYVNEMGVAAQVSTSAGEAVYNTIPAGATVVASAAGALGSVNQILVGGPCVNSLAAEFKGNPADCAEGFEEGMGLIEAKDVGDNVVILVAGYSGADTQNAVEALAAGEGLVGTALNVDASLKVSAPTVSAPEE